GRTCPGAGRRARRGPPPSASGWRSRRPCARERPTERAAGSRERLFNRRTATPPKGVSRPADEDRPIEFPLILPDPARVIVLTAGHAGGGAGSRPGLMQGGACDKGPGAGG